MAGTPFALYLGISFVTDAGPIARRLVLAEPNRWTLTDDELPREPFRASLRWRTNDGDREIGLPIAGEPPK